MFKIRQYLHKYTNLIFIILFGITLYILIKSKFYYSLNQTEILDEVSQLIESESNLPIQLLEFIKTNIFNLKDFLHNYSEWLDTLNQDQLYAMFHILTSMTIFISLITIISVFYGDLLFNYFKIETRFPRFKRFFELRRKYRQFYILWHFTLICLVLIAIVVFNLYVFFTSQ